MLELNNELRLIGTDLTSRLKSISPVSTGKMRNSLDYLVDKDKLVIQVIDYYKYLEDRFIDKTIQNYDIEPLIELVEDNARKELLRKIKNII